MNTPSLKIPPRPKHDTRKTAASLAHAQIGAFLFDENYPVQGGKSLVDFYGLTGLRIEWEGPDHKRVRISQEDLKQMHEEGQK